MPLVSRVGVHRTVGGEGGAGTWALLAERRGGDCGEQGQRWSGDRVVARREQRRCGCVRVCAGGAALGEVRGREERGARGKRQRGGRREKREGEKRKEKKRNKKWRERKKERVRGKKKIEKEKGKERGGGRVSARRR